MKGFIYKYTFPDGKIYIGQTRRPIEIRHREHLNPSTGPLNSGFWEAYQTVGEPTLSILETIESDDVTALVNMLNEIETSYILAERADDPRYGYNRKSIATAYSPDLALLEKEFRRLYRQAIEEVAPFFDSIYEKLISDRNTELDADERSFIRGSLLENNLFSDSVRELLDENDFSLKKTTGLEMLEEALEYAKWNYGEETEEIIHQYVSEHASEILQSGNKGKIIQQIDSDGNIVQEFITHDQIRRAFNISRIDNILNVLKGRQRSAYGFSWRYKPVDEES